jgi:hypothetical protein
MKPENIPEIIKEVKSMLHWKIRHEKEGDTLHITSNPEVQVHIIHLPAVRTPAGDVQLIEYLHELGHAWLAEKRGPVFAVHKFRCIGRAFKDVYPILEGPVKATGDWFADDLLMQWAPVSARAQIAEYLDPIWGAVASGLKMDAFLLITSAFVIAQGVQYLPKRPRIPGKLKSLVDEFLSVSPAQPCTDNYSSLLNGLLKPFSNLRARWISRQGEWLVE